MKVAQLDSSIQGQSFDQKRPKMKFLFVILLSIAAAHAGNNKIVESLILKNHKQNKTSGLLRTNRTDPSRTSQI